MGRLDVHIRHGHDGPGPWAALAVLIGLAIVGGATRHAIGAALRVVITVLEVAAWCLAGAAGVAVVIGAALAYRRARRVVRAVQARRAAAPVIRIAPETAVRPLKEGSQPAIGARPQAQARDSWPLPGWWEEVRPHIGGDGNDQRPR